VIFSVGFSCASALESTSVHWHFDGEPGTPFTEEGSDTTKLAGEIASKGGPERQPLYGEPAPGGGKGSLLLRNEGASEADGGFACPLAIAGLVIGKSELTIEAWIKPDEIRQASILRLTSSGQDEGVILETQPDGRVGFLILADHEVKAAVISNAGQLISGEWQHVAGVFQNGMISLYLNGKRIGVRSVPGITTIPEQLAFGGVGAYVRRMGERGKDTGQFFSGNIDEMRITTKALAPDEFFAQP